MISPEDDAARLFNKWKKEECLVKMLLSCPSGGGSLAGFVAEVEWPTVRIAGADRVSEFTIDLREASFEYAEEEDSSELEDEGSGEYPAILLVSLPSGFRAGFFEFAGGIHRS
jgi:hypothetical protein